MMIISPAKSEGMMKLNVGMKNGLAKVKYQVYEYFSLISLCYLINLPFLFIEFKKKKSLYLALFRMICIQSVALILL